MKMEEKFREDGSHQLERKSLILKVVSPLKSRSEVGESSQSMKKYECRIII